MTKVTRKEAVEMVKDFLKEDFEMGGKIKKVTPAVIKGIEEFFPVVESGNKDFTVISEGYRVGVIFDQGQWMAI